MGIGRTQIVWMLQKNSYGIDGFACEAMGPPEAWKSQS